MNRVKLFASKVNPEDRFEDYASLLSSVSDEKQKQINDFKFDADKLRCIKAELLLRKVLIERYNIPAKNILYKLNEYGKPFLIGNEIQFNLSHSGEWAVCAVSPAKVGVDIEQIQPINFSIAHRFFSKKEVEILNSLPESKKQDYFFEIWTLKESFIKAVGKGLSIPLDSFSIVKNSNSIELKSEEYSGYYFKQYHIDDKHKLAICSKDNNFSEKIIFY